MEKVAGGATATLNQSPAEREAQQVQPDADVFSRPPPKKRRRIVISCVECHRRKQKCDRGLPCANCVSRNKQYACRYETGAPAARTTQPGSKGAESATPSQSPADGSLNGGGGKDYDLRPKGANFGYTSSDPGSVLGLLGRLDKAASGGGGSQQLASISVEPDQDQAYDNVNTRERFKVLIRQLPARTFIKELVDIYFSECNFTYFPLEEGHFHKQLAEWYLLSFSVINTVGPKGLALEMRAFPAMLFQVLASALVILPKSAHSTFDSLKYAGGMTFDDLAMDYSESGMAILALLGKRQMSLNTVLADFLRASFLKYSGLVTESWHAIGSAVRDAQEIGLHREALDPKPRPGADAAEVLENEWEIQHRRRTWHLLIIWDLHMSGVLGRPNLTDAEMLPPLPVDCPIPRDRSREPIRPRGENDPPTPLTRIVWMHQAMRNLYDAIQMGKEGSRPRDFSRVDKLHERILQLDEIAVPCLRSEDPDLSFDSLPECYWLPLLRPTLPQKTAFCLMVLHRPLVFTRKESRTHAIKACLQILQAQKAQFYELKPEHYKSFSIFFGTFDAIVLVATLYIIFPKEHRELLKSVLQHFQWSVERFEAMSVTNKLAKTALTILQAIYTRLKKAVGLGFVNTSTTTNGNGKYVAASEHRQLHHLSPSPSEGTPRAPLETPTSATVSAADDFTAAALTCPTTVGSTGGSSMSYGGGAGSDPYGASSIPTPDQQGPDWSLPADFDWGSIPTLYAMEDLVYKDLMIGDEAAATPSTLAAAGGGGGGGGGASTSTAIGAELQAWAAGDSGAVGLGAGGFTGFTGGVGHPPSQGNAAWQFEGDFAQNSVWNLLNYAPV